MHTNINKVVAAENIPNQTKNIVFKQLKMRRRALRRKVNEMRNQRNVIEINSSSATSFENSLSISANDNPRSVVSSSPNCSYSPYSPQPIWHPRSFAGRHNDPRFHSSFPPVNEISSYNVNMHENLPQQQEEPRSTNSWKHTGNLLKYEEEFTRDMKILCDYIQSENTCPDDEHDNFLVTLRRLSIDYLQCLLKERNVLKNSGNRKKLKENTDFIIERLDSILNVFRLANKATGISKMHQEALVSSEKVLEAVKIQLIEEHPSVSSPCEAPSPRFNQEQTQDLEEARKEVYMLLGELAGTQNELEKVRKELKSQIDVVNPLVPKLLQIRASLLEKIKCSEILKESFAKRITAEQIIFDIMWLTTDTIQFKDDKKGEEVPDTAHSSKVLKVTENEVHLVTMIASFLRTISFSVNLDYIYSYVEKVDNALSRQYIESLLKKYPTFFQEESVSGGTEKKWSYLELKPIITI